MTAELELLAPLPVLSADRCSAADFVVPLSTAFPWLRSPSTSPRARPRPEHLERLVVDRLAADGIADLPEGSLGGTAGHRCVVALDPRRIAVVIPTRDRREAPRTLLESVLRSGYPDFDEVVDNAAYADATRDMVAERFRTDPRVMY